MSENHAGDFRDGTVTADAQASPPRRRHWLAALLPPLLVVMLAAGGAAWLLGTKGEARRAKPERQARLVETATLTATTPQLRLEAWGAVQAARQVTLQARVAGEVSNVAAAFAPGGRFAAGEVMLQIDAADYILQQQQREAELTRARAELTLEEGRGEVAAREMALMEQQSPPSPQQRLLMLRQPQLASLKAAVTSAEAALAAAVLNVERTTLKAPFNTMVLERFVNVGSRVGAGANIASIVDTDVFWVDLAVPQASLQWLQLPQQGRDGATLRLYQDKVWGEGQYREARIVGMRGELDSKGRMAHLLAAVDDPLALTARAPQLLPGAFVRAEIEGRRIDDALSAPREWLRDDDTLWVMDADDKLSIRRTRVILGGKDEVFVQGGVSIGERIVTSDLAVAVEGMPLRVATGGETP